MVTCVMERGPSTSPHSTGPVHRSHRNHRLTARTLVPYFNRDSRIFFVVFVHVGGLVFRLLKQSVPKSINIKFLNKRDSSILKTCGFIKFSE